jgi:hypothetical protein
MSVADIEVSEHLAILTFVRGIVINKYCNHETGPIMSCIITIQKIRPCRDIDYIFPHTII